MSFVWATGREFFGLMPVSAAKVATSSAMTNQVSQVTPLLLADTLPFDSAVASIGRRMRMNPVLERDDYVRRVTIGDQCPRRVR